MVAANSNSFAYSSKADIGCQVPTIPLLRKGNFGTSSSPPASVASTSLVPPLSPLRTIDHDFDVCRYASWSWLNTASGEIAEFNCGSWHCPVHRGAVAWGWAKRVAESKPERMITLTDIPDDRVRAYLGFKHLVRDVRKLYDFQYARFLEVGSKTGMLHWHLAQRGDYIPQRFLSSRASANGLGEVVDIRRCRGQGVGFYLGKYVTKESAPAGWRKVTVSRGYPKPVAPVVSGDWILRKGV